MTKQEEKLKQAIEILTQLDLPRSQLNERTALCLLCLLDMTPEKDWSQATNPLVGITPIMDWSKKYYQKNYAPNTRETFRRQSIHQFVQAGICLYNPDMPKRPVNSPKAVYQIEPALLNLIKTYGTNNYPKLLKNYLKEQQTLSEKYARERNMNMIPITLKNGQKINLSVGEHSELIKKIIEDFGSRFAPGGSLVYIGDAGDKYGYFDTSLLEELGVQLDNHSKLPDVIIYYAEKNWLLLIESVTSHGPVDAKRREELSILFKDCTAGLVYVSAFLIRKTFLKYSEVIAWETEVWIADSPTHMIHFNGSRFLGPTK